MASCGSFKYYSNPDITHVLAITELGDTIQVPISQLKRDVQYTYGYSYYNNWRFYYNGWHWGYQYFPQHYYYYGRPTTYNRPYQYRPQNTSRDETLNRTRRLSPTSNRTINNRNINQRQDIRRPVQKTRTNKTVRKKNNIYK